jgi:hypothetical protein
VVHVYTQCMYSRCLCPVRHGETTVSQRVVKLNSSSSSSKPQVDNEVRVRCRDLNVGCVRVAGGGE